MKILKAVWFKKPLTDAQHETLVKWFFISYVTIVSVIFFGGVLLNLDKVL